MTCITDHIGNTPLLRLRSLEHGAVEVYAKAEWFNPSGSVKDRPAWSIVREAIQSGALRPGMTIVDSSSGNAGISYAMIGAALGYPVTIYMSASASEERKRIIRGYGASIVLTDPERGSDGAYQVAQSLAEDDDWIFYANQYANPANWRAHAETTGPEIWRQTKGRVTHVVAGVGTGGTVRGIVTALQARNPQIASVGVIPADEKHQLPGLRHLPTAMAPAIWHGRYADALQLVSDRAAREMAARVGRGEGLCIGPSGGAALVAAEALAARLESGVVVTVLPDSGERYLSL